jgi:hypothetical protein
MVHPVACWNNNNKVDSVKHNTCNVLRYKYGEYGVKNCVKLHGIPLYAQNSRNLYFIKCSITNGLMMASC